MKVSIIHAERRCPQVLAFDVVSPECVPVGSSASGSDGEPFPATLRPSQRFDFALPVGALLAFVASAPLKQRGSPAPLLVELEAEEGETLHDDSLRAFMLDAPAAASRAARSPPPAAYTVAALGEGHLVRVDVPLTRAGDRQQFAVARIEIERTRDVLLAIDNRARELAPAVLEETGQVSAPVNVGRGVCAP